MVTAEWDSTEEREKLQNLHTTAEIEDRFRKVFKREMTPEERHAFFMPNDESKKPPA